MTIKFDFHCHSHFSDGQLSPQALIEYATEREIQLLALTDHDTISGLEEVSRFIGEQDLPIKLINGVEISALSEFGEVHIVGLAIDPRHSELCCALSEQQQKRWQRAENIDEKLQKLGVNGVLDWCKIHVKQVVTRSHMAKALVDLGYAKDLQQAFKKYIGKKGKVKVPKDWMSLPQAIELIGKAGGVSVLAHPTRYPLSNRKLSLLIESFKQAGGDAIEMAYPSLNADKIAWLKIQRENHNLLASSGSDFHYPNLKWTDLGRFPHLDAGIPHVRSRLN